MRSAALEIPSTKQLEAQVHSRRFSREFRRTVAEALAAAENLRQHYAKLAVVAAKAHAAEMRKLAALTGPRSAVTGKLLLSK